jgi:hypothetical protein
MFSYYDFYLLAYYVHLVSHNFRVMPAEWRYIWYHRQAYGAMSDL